MTPNRPLNDVPFPRDRINTRFILHTRERPTQDTMLYADDPDTIRYNIVHYPFKLCHNLHKSWLFSCQVFQVWPHKTNTVLGPRFHRRWNCQVDEKAYSKPARFWRLQCHHCQLGWWLHAHVFSSDCQHSCCGAWNRSHGQHHDCKQRHLNTKYYFRLWNLFFFFIERIWSRPSWCSMHWTLSGLPHLWLCWRTD